MNVFNINLNPEAWSNIITNKVKILQFLFSYVLAAIFLDIFHRDIISIILVNYFLISLLLIIFNYKYFSLGKFHFLILADILLLIVSYYSSYIFLLLSQLIGFILGIIIGIMVIGIIIFILLKALIQFIKEVSDGESDTSNFTEDKSKIYENKVMPPKERILTKEEKRILAFNKKRETAYKSIRQSGIKGTKVFYQRKGMLICGNCGNTGYAYCNKCGKFTERKKRGGNCPNCGGLIDRIKCGNCSAVQYLK